MTCKQLKFISHSSAGWEAWDQGSRRFSDSVWNFLVRGGHLLTVCTQGRKNRWAVKGLVCCFCCLVAVSCLTLRNPTDCSPPGSSVHWIFPGKNTGVGNTPGKYISSSRGSPQPKDQTHISCIGRQILYCQNHQGPQGLFFVVVQLLSHVPLFAIPWTVACQSILHYLPEFDQIQVHWDGLFYKGFNCIREGSTLITLQRPHIQIPSHCHEQVTIWYQCAPATALWQ